MGFRAKTFCLIAVGALVLSACGGSDDFGGAGDGDVANTSGEASTASESADADGTGSNEEAQQRLDEAGVDIDLDELEDTITGFSTGEGGGVVTIDGVAYDFIAEVCYSLGADFYAGGPGQAPDGTVAWIEVQFSDEFDFGGDGVSDPTAGVSVVVGQTETFGRGSDDQPEFHSDSELPQHELEYTRDGGRMAGSGEIEDYSGVAIEYGQTHPFTFEASCS